MSESDYLDSEHFRENVKAGMLYMMSKGLMTLPECLSDSDPVMKACAQEILSDITAATEQQQTDQRMTDAPPEDPPAEQTTQPSNPTISTASAAAAGFKRGADDAGLPAPEQQKRVNQNGKNGIHSIFAEHILGKRERAAKAEADSGKTTQATEDIQGEQEQEEQEQEEQEQEEQEQEEQEQEEQGWTLVSLVKGK